MSSPDNGPPTKLVPVTVLTGFLGSGKTTLLNHIIKSNAHGMRFAIIENEFGEVGVDDKILAEETNEEVIEVMNGCICCTVRGDLVQALKRLHAKVEQFDGVIIETTGLADPAPVAQTFFVDDDIKELYLLDGIITVVDAKYIRTRLKEEKPEGVENEAVEQVAFADRLLLNKVDLASSEDIASIEKDLKEINPAAPIVHCKYGEVDPKELINIRAFALRRVLDMDADFLNTEGEHEHDASVVSLSCKFTGELNINALEEWISELIGTYGANLYRYKGVLAVKAMRNKFVFQGVGMLFSGSFSDVPWKEDETRECRFVFIGKNIDKDELRDGFMACQVGELRFKEGDVVEVPMGEDPPRWVRAKVLRVWDNGDPYVVKLEPADTAGRRRRLTEDPPEITIMVDNDKHIRTPTSGKVDSKTDDANLENPSILAAREQTKRQKLSPSTAAS